MAPARKIRGLSADESFRSAAGKIIWTRLDEMMSHREAALAGDDIEGVHDMRVGSRRLRAAIELFRDVFQPRELRPMLREVKLLADSLGEVRDLDVMMLRMKKELTGRPPAQRFVFKELLSDLDQQRHSARSKLSLVVEDMERTDFPRRFLAFVARETTR